MANRVVSYINQKNNKKNLISVLSSMTFSARDEFISNTYLFNGLFNFSEPTANSSNIEIFLAICICEKFFNIDYDKS